MKIVCDCGEMLEFVIDKSVEDPDDEINAESPRCSSIHVEPAHDECWISCKKCNAVVHFFT